jgi:hypothetical protein
VKEGGSDDEYSNVDRVSTPKRDFDRMADKRNFHVSACDMSGLVDLEHWERVKRRYGAET